jgi:uncharacterized MnhB-related membrane protein
LNVILSDTVLGHSATLGIEEVISGFIFSLVVILGLLGGVEFLDIFNAILSYTVLGQSVVLVTEGAISGVLVPNVFARALGRANEHCSVRFSDDPLPLGLENKLEPKSLCIFLSFQELLLLEDSCKVLSPLPATCSALLLLGGDIIILNVILSDTVLGHSATLGIEEVISGFIFSLVVILGLLGGVEFLDIFNAILSYTVLGQSVVLVTEGAISGVLVPNVFARALGLIIRGFVKIVCLLLRIFYLDSIYFPEKY